LAFAGFVEFEGAVQGVGRFLIVIEHEVPTDSAHLHGILYAQTPAGNIDLVDTLIAEIAVAGIPEPVPVVMETILAELALGSGAGPEVVVDSFRHCRNRRAADGIAPLVAKTAREINIADQAFAHFLHRFLHGLGRADLAALLHHPVVFTGGLYNLLG